LQTRGAGRAWGAPPHPSDSRRSGSTRGGACLDHACGRRACWAALPPAAHAAIPLAPPEGGARTMRDLADPG